MVLTIFSSFIKTISGGVSLRHILLKIALIALLVSPAKANDRVDESVALIDRLIGHIHMVISNDPSEEEVLKETNYIIDNYFDYDLVARFSAGQAWRSASDNEREAYKIAFRQVMLNLAKTQFKSLATLEYFPKQAVPKGDRLVVASGIIHDKTGEFADATISWRVSTKTNQPVKIIDIEVENISMLITRQQEHTAIIQQNGGSFQALIDALIAQAEDIDKSPSAN